MSIINEALSKITRDKKQNLFERRISLEENKTRPFEFENVVRMNDDSMDILPAKKPLRKKLNFRLLFLFWFLGCISIIFIYNALFPRDNNLKNMVLSGNMQDKVKPRMSAAIDKTDSPFKLSGIFLDKDKSFAIINDEVVWEGTAIKGAKVISIDAKNVKLLLNKKEIALSAE